MKVVGITSCPSGVAHTYMAAEALKLSGQKLGIDVIIETQGGAGVENQLKQKDIDEAACVILVNDVALEGLDRFKGKKVLKRGDGEYLLLFCYLRLERRAAGPRRGKDYV